MVPERAWRCAASAAARTATSEARPISRSTRTTTCTSVTATPTPRRQVRQAWRVGEVVGLARARRAARGSESGTVQHAAQHRGGPSEQCLRRRPQQPAHSGLRPGGHLRAVHLPQRHLRQDTSPGARQPPANPPDETQPWTLCITCGQTQYLYTSDSEPGRIYKMTLDGKIIGTIGISGRDVKQFNWIHSLACPTETRSTWRT